MKLIWKIVGIVVKLAVVAAGLVVGFELADHFQDRERARYLVDEDFDD